jgi:hypothetical protein
MCKVHPALHNENTRPEPQKAQIENSMQGRYYNGVMMIMEKDG